MSEIEEIETVAALFHKQGEEIRVAVKDAGNGAVVDLRTFFVAEEGELRPIKKGGRWVQVPAYSGHGKNGFWLANLDTAEELFNAGLVAVRVARDYNTNGPAPEDWTCPKCNAENEGKARRCHACDGSRRRDFLAVEA